MSLMPELSWIGDVPSDWELIPLKYAVTYNDEVLPESTGTDVELNYVEISDVEATRGIHNYTRVAFGQAPSRARRVAQSGDVLVSTVRTYLRAIASVSQGPLIASTGFAVLRARPLVTSEYLRYLCLSGPFVESVIVRSTGVSYPAINSSDLVQTRVPVPPIPAQVAVSTYLDRETAKIDALINKQKQLIAALREDRAATITHAVTKGLDPDTETVHSGSSWLGPIPIYWSKTRLRNIISLIESGTSVNCSDVLASPGEAGVLKTSCVSSGRFDPTQHKTAFPEEAQRVTCPVTAETIIVNRANTPDLVGSAGYVEKDVPGIYLSDLLWSVSVVGARPDFVHAWMQGAVYRTQVAASRTGTSASMQKLSKSSLRSFEIALPPFQEQGKIVEFLVSRRASIDALIDKSTEMIETLREYRSALITNAVTGKIDVREAV